MKQRKKAKENAKNKKLGFMSSGKRLDLAYISSGYGTSFAAQEKQMQRGTSGGVTAEEMLRRKMQQDAAAAEPPFEVSQQQQRGAGFGGDDNNAGADFSDPNAAGYDENGFQQDGTGEENLDDFDADPVEQGLQQQVSEMEAQLQDAELRAREEKLESFKSLIEERGQAVSQLTRREGIYDGVGHAVHHIKSAPGIVTVSFEARFLVPTTSVDLAEDQALKLHGASICAPVVNIDPAMSAQNDDLRHSSVRVTAVHAPTVALEDIDFVKGSMALVAVTVNAKKPSVFQGYKVFLKAAQTAQVLNTNGSIDVPAQGTQAVHGGAAKHSGGDGIMYVNLDAALVARTGELDPEHQHGDHKSMATREHELWQKVQHIIDGGEICKHHKEGEDDEGHMRIYLYHKSWTPEQLNTRQGDFEILLEAFNTVVPDDGAIDQKDLQKAKKFGFQMVPYTHWNLFTKIVKQRASMAVVTNQGAPQHYSQIHQLTGTVSELLEMCAVPSALALEYNKQIERAELARRYGRCAQAYVGGAYEKIKSDRDHITIYGQATFALN